MIVVIIFNRWMFGRAAKRTAPANAISQTTDDIILTDWTSPTTGSEPRFAKLTISSHCKIYLRGWCLKETALGYLHAFSVKVVPAREAHNPTDTFYVFLYTDNTFGLTATIKTLPSRIHFLFAFKLLLRIWK